MEQKNFFNFKSDETFNLNDEYTNLFGEGGDQKPDPNQSKLKDAENIISDFGAKYAESISLQKYEYLFTNLDSFLNKFRTDSEEVKNMTKDERDKLFGYGRELFSAYQNQYNVLHFNFEVSMKEWNFIESVLTKKLSYNGNELFNYWKLYVDFIEPTKNSVKQLAKSTESFMPVCSIQSLVLLSHLLMKHEEKGSTEQFYHYKNVLNEIALMTKLFNAYGVVLERITNMFNNWVDALNAIDGYNNIDTLNEPVSGTESESQQ